MTNLKDICGGLIRIYILKFASIYPLIFYMDMIYVGTHVFAYDTL